MAVCLLVFLDASKAFDRVNHRILFTKLGNMGTPPQYIIRIILLSFWYANQQMCIHWGGTYSTSSMPNQNTSFHRYMPIKNECNLFLSPVLEEDIISTVNACKSKTSCDHNNIDMVIVKQVINYIAKPLAHVCSKSFECGVFPDNIKVAKVVPLFKAGDRSLFSNYRPISLLSQFSKILEKLFNERLDKFIDKFQLLNNCQYGFRSQMSTSHALLDLVEEITSSIDAKKISIGVFIDLKKAFYTVNHDLLIDKLEYYGIRGIAQEWLKSYLKDRKQFVQIDECASTLLSVTCGVPQGSILGPKLFIFILFADDTNIFYSGVDIQTLCECISRELNKLHVWLSVNKLSLNVDKTNYILFGNRKYIDNVCISMNNSIITRVRATTFLGVIIDEKLTWNDHLSLVRSKLAKTVGILYRVRHLLNRSALFILYCSLFYHI